MAANLSESDVVRILEDADKPEAQTEAQTALEAPVYSDNILGRIGNQVWRLVSQALTRKKNPQPQQIAENTDGLKRPIALRNDSSDYRNSLVESQFETGDKVVATTSKGFNYPMELSEDGMIVFPDGILVIDGFDGGANGNKGRVCTEIIAEKVFEKREERKKDFLFEGMKAAHSKIQEDPSLYRSGAVYAYVGIEKIGNKKNLDTSYLGDCKIIVIRNRKIIFSSDEDTFAYTLYKAGKITEYECLHHITRNNVLCSISPSFKFNEETYESRSKKIRVKEGDLVLVMSDGIASNLTPEEIAEFIENDEKSTLVSLCEIVNDRMKHSKALRVKGRNEDEVYADELKSPPKPDNFTLGVIKVS